MLESKYLKDDIKNIQQLLAIPALKKFETQDLARLLRLSKIRKYEDAEVIIQEYDKDPWLYFLLSGAIRVSKGGVDIATIDRMGEIFGEMSLIDGLSRSTSVYASGKTICLSVDTASKERLDSDLDAANLLNMLYRVASEYVSLRLRLTNEKLIQAEKEIARLRNESPNPAKQEPGC